MCQPTSSSFSYLVAGQGAEDATYNHRAKDFSRSGLDGGIEPDLLGVSALRGRVRRWTGEDGGQADNEGFEVGLGKGRLDRGGGFGRVRVSQCVPEEIGHGRHLRHFVLGERADRHGGGSREVQSTHVAEVGFQPWYGRLRTRANGAVRFEIGVVWRFLQQAGEE